MAITLSKSGTTINLPDDLIWVDRDSWSPVVQNVATSITGAAIIDVQAKTNGRPITLSGDEQHAWIPYSTVLQLRALAADPGAQLSLSIGGATYSVVFRHQDAPALDVSPVVDYATPDAQDFYYGSLKFMEI